MKVIAITALTLMMLGVHTCCHAVTCSCDDWMERGGYCVDYIKDRIPSFKIPYKDDMDTLKNTDISNVTEGDVAVFTIKNFWHVAYVERVHRDAKGEPTAIDVSEKNFGDELSFHEFREKWKSNSKSEWNRAICCGVSDNYDEVTWRKNIDVDTVKQIWSPDDVASGDARPHRIKAIVKKVKEVINRLIQRAEGEL